MSTRYEELEENLRMVEEEIVQFSPTLIVVTKTYPASDVEILYQLGVRHFGENRSDEGLAKSSAVPSSWHYQGEIQSKKLREISNWASYIHSLDKAEHLAKLQRILQERSVEISLFLQLSLDGNPLRGGIMERELFSLAEKVAEVSEVRMMGLMCVPPLDVDPATAFAEIGRVHQRFSSAFPESPYLSAGMSGDYLTALHHGATHIRVGSKILGARRYD